VSEYKPCCPNCLSPAHVAYHLKIHFSDRVLDCGPVYGEMLRHCESCGLKFHASKAVELRELEPVEPPRSSGREWERWTM
jgi:hypothetical protein